MKSEINPVYASLRRELLTAIQGETKVEKVFCNNRNTVELVDIDGIKMVVKRYRRPGIFNRLVYTFFRKTKARRAYKYAELLNSKGFNSPTPVAYFEKFSKGVFQDGYFISEYVECPSVQDYFFGDRQLAFESPERTNIALQLSKLTLQLHDQGIQPLDYNMSNILVEDVNTEEMKFWLIDLNRMRIGRQPGLKQAMLSFFQLGTYYPDYAKLLEPYAAARGWDVEECIYHVIRHRRGFNRLRRLKQYFKHLFRR